MPKGRGKGRISNNLVAASCAAVLTVYAAGYWRTRDAARHFEEQAKARRPVARTIRAPLSPTPAILQPSASPPHPPPQALVTSTPAEVATIGSSPVTSPKAARARRSIRTARAKAIAAARLSAVVAPQTTPAPVAAQAGMLVAPVPLPSELTPVSRSAPEPPATPAARWRDGVYTGHGDSPHGDLDVRVVIRGGRIIEAAIDTCNTRYPCNLLDPMVRQAVVIQSSNVDYVSHATESSEAYNDGLVEALNKALDPTPGKEPASQ